MVRLLVVTQDDGGSMPSPPAKILEASVTQLEECRTCNAKVGGSKPPRGSNFEDR